MNKFLYGIKLYLQLIQLGLWLGSWRGHIKPPHWNKSYQLVTILHCQTWPIMFWVHIIYNLVQTISSIKSRQHNYHSFVIKLIHRVIIFDSRTMRHTFYSFCPWYWIKYFIKIYIRFILNFIQVDFGTILPIHGVGTQGHSQLDVWVTKYKLATSLDGVTFVNLKEKTNKTDLVCNITFFPSIFEIMPK